MTVSRIGFVGIGRMGAPMARRLIDAGRRVTVFDTDEAAVQGLIAAGANQGASPADVASRTDAVFLSLPTPEVVRSVAFGPSGLVEGRAEPVIIDLSTTGPRVASELDERLTPKGMRVVDCPVSGGVAGAKKGTLAVMVACERGLFDELDAVLKTFGKTFYVGAKPGMAQMMKVINNLMSVTSIAISSEALVLGTKFGLDPDVMIDVINAGSGRNGATADKMPNFVLTRSFDFGFQLALSAKDLRLCLDESEALGVPMLVGSAVHQFLNVAKGRLGPDADLTTLIKPVEEWAGVEVVGKGGKG